jgi:hypothetical protein
MEFWTPQILLKRKEYFHARHKAIYVYYVSYSSTQKFSYFVILLADTHRIGYELRMLGTELLLQPISNHLTDWATSIQFYQNYIAKYISNPDFT